LITFFIKITSLVLKKKNQIENIVMQKIIIITKKVENFFTALFMT
jgi:hypothetical protein